uniref:Ras-GEF domain-containing protein n=1 Tax=Arcella intermedia TaxID=1963864 RepID=A0A6B2L358_9EUKA
MKPAVSNEAQPLASEEQVSEDFLLTTKNGDRTVKGASIDKMIHLLIYSDSKFVDMILLTYRTYMSPTVFLEKLFSMYHSPPSNPFAPLEPVTVRDTRVKLANIVKHWVTTSFENDFANDPALFKLLYNYVNQTFCSAEIKLGSRIHRAINTKNDQLNSFRNLTVQFQYSEKPPTPIFPKGNDFVDFDNYEIARQLCLYEQHLYKSVHPSEFLNQSWRNNKTNAPNLTKAIEYFNRMTNWVVTQIILKENDKERFKMVRKFIKIMICASKYNNFSTMREICAAFGSAAVWRLKATWALIEKEKKVYEEYTRIMALLAPDKNFKNYREALQTSNPPCLPYLGQYLTDLTFIEDGNPDYLPLPQRKDIINIEKMTRIATTIQQICLYQQHSYFFEKVDPIYNFLGGDLPFLSEQECYARSKELEPS